MERESTLPLNLAGVMRSRSQLSQTVHRRDWLRGSRYQT
jgi:hypothetical protein